MAYMLHFKNYSLGVQTPDSELKDAKATYDSWLEPALALSLMFEHED